MRAVTVAGRMSLWNRAENPVPIIPARTVFLFSWVSHQQRFRSVAIVGAIAIQDVLQGIEVLDGIFRTEAVPDLIGGGLSHVV